MIIKNSKAFLLIEILVTVIIVSVTIVFINHAFSSSLKAASLSSDYLNAILLLEDKCFDIELNPLSEEGESSEEEEFMDTRFEFVQQATLLDESRIMNEYDEQDINLNDLKLSLKWSKQNTERDVSIQTYAYKPEPEE